ncbi:MAG TPA: hypothetical protein PKH05_16165 [Nitrospira sp.]|uniref:hypothetical protein n=2 Tax=Accumulibacter sp. TaxID=2053492 RepID=UPI002C408329|nr:hypothetical protein [Accumulibacter sp.]HNC21512.1 hypothetical protein [Accumulibacter sp.]HNG55398.1 hypothetical protein [Nitrospira sp.]HNL90615.1 hypothetical protein [Nitrospira sp.]HNO72583.1 hypothetical protein [Accumulibacter sp.]
MKRKVYVETSVISYLTARPSKTIMGAAHQQIKLAWWELRSDYELFVSQSVWQECAAGDPVAAEKNLAALEGIPVLAVTQDMIRLAGSLIEQASHHSCQGNGGCAPYCCFDTASRCFPSDLELPSHCQSSDSGKVRRVS